MTPFYARPERRVVITGCGLEGPAGVEPETFWKSSAGERTSRPIRALAPPRERREREPCTLEDAASPSIRRCAALSARAAESAFEDAGFSRGQPERERAGAVLGTTLGLSRDRQARVARADLPSLEDFFLAPDARPLTTAIARRIGVSGPVLVNAAACSSGSAALAWGYELIVSGHADLILAGGVDAAPAPPWTSRDGGSGGFEPPTAEHTLVEGAGILVLEELDHARARGAHVRAELAGYGVSHQVFGAPKEPPGICALAVQQALSTTHTWPEQVDCVFPHVLGARAAATNALRDVLGGRSAPLQDTSSAAALLGHAHGATSALETIAWVHLPKPRIRERARDPRPGEDLIPASGYGGSTCLNLTAGFGPSYVCVVIKDS